MLTNNSQHTTPQNNWICDDVKIFQWNCRSLRLRLPELEIISKTQDIIMCSETGLTAIVTRNRFFWGFNFIRKDRANYTGGGLLIAIRNNIAYKLFEISQILRQVAEIIGLTITNTKPQLHVYSVYRPPGAYLSLTEWNMITSLTQSNINSLLIGDRNAHNLTWTCSKNDLNGERLMNSLTDYNIILHNPDSITRKDQHF